MLGGIIQWIRTAKSLDASLKRAREEAQRTQRERGQLECSSVLLLAERFRFGFTHLSYRKRASKVTIQSRRIVGHLAKSQPCLSSRVELSPLEQTSMFVVIRHIFPGIFVHQFTHFLPFRLCTFSQGRQELVCMNSDEITI